MNIDQYLESIKSFMRAKNWTRNKLAREAGILEGTVRGMFKKRWNPKVETLRLLEKAIKDSDEYDG